ncbi:SbcC/MukB-like Walker B domain-containing protein [Bradyrhizobium arachidis]|uniref:P-loop containing region of AAA domain-containing protein n=1 Tax=Bradyrhizobium arachidis TaxID=858423 RepID=A0AAE7TGE8_9BRAD|nr:SbcC/MukB-like Walker B domain-containing protein [Bradyrhizobium arachidis]QOZ66701.1 hypothetical protein WN72_10430 [Bradyrhizobium arachidis]SFV14823.1 P-loop containing region of AAA domain-containing protein [Bradyrhizobium arachidis]
MMELRHLTMVNWHLFDVADIDVTGHVGVLGENRSGKSTILDMAQVVLTGGSRRFLRLNAVAGDSGKSRSGSKRSVVDYCLGTLGEDQRRRDEARTYVALGFEDKEGDRPPVTIGMALEARKSDSRETVLALFVAVGTVLSSKDFIEQRGKSQFPAPWEDVRARIVAAVGEGNFVNHRDRASDYVREYMRHLLPHSPYGEQNASALQKSIVNAMTLDHNQTATQFVRNYILEDSPIGIKELRESIQTYRNISETIRKMRLRLEALRALRVVLGTLEEALETKFREEWIAKRATWLAARATNLDFKTKRRTEMARRDAAAKQLEFIDDDVKAIDNEIERLTAAIAEHDAKTGRKSLQQTADVAGQAAHRASADFKARMENIRRLEPLRAMCADGFEDFVPALERLLTATAGADIGHVSDELSAAEKSFAASGTKWLPKIDEARQTIIAELSGLRGRRDEVLERIRQHAAGGARAYLGDDTELLCRRLRQSGMAPRVLCDIIEVAEPEWVGAAEALRQYERQAREAAEKASTLLRGEFINALTARIGKMERELQSLNRSLYAHPFHNERYSFHRTQVVEFQPILKIIEIAKTSPEALDMLFRGDAPDDFPHKDTIRALEVLLEDPDKDFTQFEDYRNFYTFEIHMEDVATGRSTRWEQRRGTGSGAEQQVPIYVAIGASLAAVYGSAERRTGKPSGFALAMFDEAFSKMDGKNQRQMMSFYKNLGLQFVIAAPFEKRVAVLEHMDTIVEVDRIGEQSRATVVELKEKAKRELMAIDPDLMSEDELGTRLAAE